MPRTFQLLILSISALFVVGCASLTEEACSNGFAPPDSKECRPIRAKKYCNSINWFAQGERLGSRGEDLGSDRFALECRELGFAADELKLAEGYKKGLEDFCSESQAKSSGFNGGEFKEKALCSKESNEMARKAHAQGAKDYCDPKVGMQIGREGKTPHKKCGSAWDKQFKLGQRELEKANVEATSARAKSLREEFYRLERKRIDLTERKVRLVGNHKATKAERQQVELEILDVDRAILKVKQEQESISSQ